jgi:two-component system NtrC family response regulator
MVQRKLFRRDLLFRIRSLTIELPPLKKRTEDIRDLVEHHVAQLCEEYGIEKKEFSPEFFPALASYDWPGNVRELVKALESAIVSARHEPMVFPIHLPTEIRAKMARTSVGDEHVGTRKRQTITNRKQTLPRLVALREAAVAEVEKNYLEDLMSLTGGKIKEACRISGLSRSRLYDLLKKHHVPTSG